MGCRLDWHLTRDRQWETGGEGAIGDKNIRYKNTRRLTGCHDAAVGGNLTPRLGCRRLTASIKHNVTLADSRLAQVVLLSYIVASLYRTTWLASVAKTNSIHSTVKTHCTSATNGRTDRRKVTSSSSSRKGASSILSNIAHKLHGKIVVCFSILHST